MTLTTGTPEHTRDRFQKLAARWRDESQFLSNTAQIAMLKSYQQIIGLGAPAVPLLLAELAREPDQWFWALEAITADDPVPPEDKGRVERMAAAWVEWGRRRGYVA